MRLGCLCVFVLFAASVAYAQTTFVGAKRCQTCHTWEYQVWAKGPHATARQSLTPEQLKDGKCNSCHTMVPAELEEQKFAGVQCESCHGGGRYYSPSFVMKDRELARAVGLVDPTAEQCQRCHNESAPSIKPFDFASMWAKIDHGRAAREAAAKQAAHEQQGDGQATAGR
ncbi:MAG TPA: multiheme c-type cytochrome [Myxococcota bacterium]|nr:multiheme c-type cytochrome [Myxococcota bacterium]